MDQSCKNPEQWIKEARVIIGIMNDADNMGIVELVELSEKLQYICRRVYFILNIITKLHFGGLVP
jgi:hypothetical protein